MKCKFFSLLLAVMMLLGCCASATDATPTADPALAADPQPGTGATLVGGDFTDVPTSTTEDTVLWFEAGIAGAEDHYGLQVLPPDQLTIDTDIAVFKFVVEGENPPARFFPEETQQQIDEILWDGAVDALYMTEFMRMHAASTDSPADVATSMLLNVEYRPGETIIVVLADTTDPENLVWTALPATVTALCQIEFTIPAELLATLQGENLIYTLLTTTPGKAIFRTEEVEQHTTVVTPSIGIEDVVEVISVTTLVGFEGERSFEMAIVRETEHQINELNNMRDFVTTQKTGLVHWFPQQIQDEIGMLLGDDVDPNNLAIYDYLPLYTIDYSDTYGDVLVTFSFLTPYQEGDRIVTVLGLPIPDPSGNGTQMKWYTQIARVAGNGVVEITFGQLPLLEMMEEPGLLMLLVERTIV